MLVDAPPPVTKSYSRKSCASANHAAPVEEREDLALVPLEEPRVRLLVERRAPELHAVLLAEALDLAVAEHRQARAASPCTVATPKYLSPLPNCSSAVSSSGLLMKLT